MKPKSRVRSSHFPRWNSRLAALLAFVLLPTTARAVTVYPSDRNDGAQTAAVEVSGPTLVHVYFKGGPGAPAPGTACSGGSTGEVCQWAIEFQASGLSILDVLFDEPVVSSETLSLVSATGGDAVDGQFGATKLATLIVAGRTPTSELTVNTPAGFGFVDAMGATLTLSPPETVARVSATPWRQLSTIGNRTCGVLGTGEATCFGDAYAPVASPSTAAFKQISTGDDFGCGIHFDDTLECWGTISGVPAGEFVQLAAGIAHICGLRPDLTVECWGAALTGVPTVDQFVQLSRGGDHVCGITLEGTLLCWGTDDFGEATPVGGPFVDLGGGYEHTCGVRDDGSVECWGNAGGADMRLTPNAGVYTAISGGGDHTCGVLDDDTATCWGNNAQGELIAPAGAFRDVNIGDGLSCGVLADGSATCWGTGSSGSGTPPLVAFRQVATGREHACTIEPDGTAACFGNASDGATTPTSGPFLQVSNGAQFSCGLTDSLTIECWGSDLDNEVSGAPAGSHVSVAAGGAQACAIEADGDLFCWGEPSSGVTTPPSGTFLQISLEKGHACGLRSDFSVACWGTDFLGSVSGVPSGSFLQVVAGGQHSCGVRPSGAIDCWGDNAAGQSTPPVGSFRAVSAGGSNTCALKTDDTIACWGAAVAATAPVGTFLTLDMGGNGSGAGHGCAVHTEGALVCWGDNTAGVSLPPRDLDSDGIEDPVDNCPEDVNIDQLDSDGDGAGDACDNCQAPDLPEANAAQFDRDADGVGDSCDICPDVPDGPDLGTCIVGPIGTTCTSDAACGGTPGSCEQSQGDSNGDGVGDVCVPARIILRPAGAPAAAPGGGGFGSLTFAGTSTEFEIFLSCGALPISRVELGITLPSEVDPLLASFGPGCNATNCSSATGLGPSVDPATSLTLPAGSVPTLPDTLYIIADGRETSPFNGNLCDPFQTVDIAGLDTDVTPAGGVTPSFTPQGLAQLVDPNTPSFTGDPFQDQNSQPIPFNNFALAVGAANAPVVIELVPALSGLPGDWNVVLRATDELHRVTLGFIGPAGSDPNNMRFVGCDVPDVGLRRTCTQVVEMGPFVDTADADTATDGPGLVLPVRADTLYVTLEGNLFLNPADPFPEALNYGGEAVVLGVVQTDIGTLSEPPILTLDGAANVAPGSESILATDGAGISGSEIELVGSGVFAGDADQDGVLDDADNCIFAPNPNQLDDGTFDSPLQDGIGNVCQCADVTGDGVIGDGGSFPDDSMELRSLLAGMSGQPEADLRCSISGDATCDMADVVVLQRAFSAGASGPGLSQVCAKAVPGGGSGGDN